MTESENSSNGLGLIGLISAIVAVWAVFHMDKTFEFLNTHLPFTLGEWIGWAVILYGWFVVAVVGVFLLLVIAALVLTVAKIVK